MYTYIWLGLMVLFLIVEATTVTMVSLWFAGGALAALAVSAMDGSFLLQIIAFALVSTVMLALLRPIARKHFTPKLTRTNVDSVIGMEGYVTGDIDNVAATGTVKLGAMEWTARSVTGEKISTGTLVKVEKIEGVKAFVTPVDVPAKV